MSKTIIFTNGCFDILHRAHIELLEYAKSLGDQLIVGLNGDDSVRKLKGPTRPIHSQEDRKKILESVCFVDEVIIFNDETPYNLINQLRPDIIVKGGDYNPKDVAGSDLCKVEIFDYIDGYSTTKIIESL